MSQMIKIFFYAKNLIILKLIFHSILTFGKCSIDYDFKGSEDVKYVSNTILEEIKKEPKPYSFEKDFTCWRKKLSEDMQKKIQSIFFNIANIYYKDDISFEYLDTLNAIKDLKPSNGILIQKRMGNIFQKPEFVSIYVALAN